MMRVSIAPPRRADRFVGSHPEAQLDGLPVTLASQIDHRVDVCPAEFAHHACCAAIGLFAVPSISPL